MKKKLCGFFSDRWWKFHIYAYINLVKGNQKESGRWLSPP